MLTLLAGNFFEGDLPSLRNNTDLQIIDVAFHALNGNETIPQSWTNLASLKFLIAFSMTTFGAELPGHLFELPELSYINLFNCSYHFLD